MMLKVKSRSEMDMKLYCIRVHSTVLKYKKQWK